MPPACPPPHFIHLAVGAHRGRLETSHRPIAARRPPPDRLPQGQPSSNDGTTAPKTVTSDRFHPSTPSPTQHRRPPPETPSDTNESKSGSLVTPWDRLAQVLGVKVPPPSPPGGGRRRLYGPQTRTGVPSRGRRGHRCVVRSVPACVCMPPALAGERLEGSSEGWGEGRLGRLGEGAHGLVLGATHAMRAW